VDCDGISGGWQLLGSVAAGVFHGGSDCYYITGTVARAGVSSQGKQDSQRCERYVLESAARVWEANGN
jgi:hypothetical protein